MISPESFRYEEREGIAVITLDRPKRLNAITFAVYSELTRLFADLRSRDEVRAVILTGAGRAFCSGGDVRDIIGELQSREMQGLLEFTRLTCELVRNIRLLPKPVIASINGVAAGAGAVLAIAADLRVASEEARIGFIFTGVGLSGADMGAAFLLPRITGLAKASELLMTGSFITAQEAERIGLYNKVVLAPDLENETWKLATDLAKGPAFAIAMTKEMLNREMSVSLDTALEWEAQAQSICLQHPDFREAHQAFLEKRKPNFIGSAFHKED